MKARKYSSLYERLVANTREADPENSNSCWEWTGHVDRGGYAIVSVRVDGKPKGLRAARLMLECVHGVRFPFDQAGHLCCNPACIRPSHLEVQTLAHNLAERRGYGYKIKKSWIPVLFPVEDELQSAADRAFDRPEKIGEECPF